MTMDILHRLLGHKPAPTPTARRLPARRPDAEIDIDEDESPASCGWFDSSHELQTGLYVTEHVSADAVANEMPFSFWLRVHLAAGLPACPPERVADHRNDICVA